MKKANTIQDLYNGLRDGFAACNNAFERGMLRAVVGREIRELAENTAKTRQLAVTEIKIASEFGYRNN